VHAPERAIGVEVSGNAALFRGDHKLVRNMAPYGDGQWRLYDLAADPGETRDLSQAEPELFAQMRADYAAYAAENGVLDLPAGYDIHRQIAKNTIQKLVQYYWWVLALAALVLVGAVFLIVRWAMALRRRAQPAA
jgi:arylsulfatase/uncharacterized sulfatase